MTEVPDWMDRLTDEQLAQLDAPRPLKERHTMPRLRPFFSYFGAKWRLAPTYPKPRYGTIVEPFAGSACYSLLYSHLDVVLVEKDAGVAAAWRYLIRATPAEVRALPLAIEDGKTVHDLGIDPDAEWVVRLWLSRGPSGKGTPMRPNAWMRKYAVDYPGSFWGERVRERIASQVDAVKHWQVVKGDYSQAPDVEATWFVDPPYQIAGKHYTNGCRSGDLDYGELAEWCRQRRGQVTVCENEGATWLPFARHAQTHGMNRSSIEAVWDCSGD